MSSFNICLPDRIIQNGCPLVLNWHTLCRDLLNPSAEKTYHCHNGTFIILLGATLDKNLIKYCRDSIIYLRTVD